MERDTLRTWFITGVSTGSGRALMIEARNRGGAVYGTVRKADLAVGVERLAPGHS